MAEICNNCICQNINCDFICIYCIHVYETTLCICNDIMHMQCLKIDYFEYVRTFHVYITMDYAIIQGNVGVMMAEKLGQTWNTDN